MEDKKDKEYFKDPQRTTMSGQPISKPGESRPETESGRHETTTGEGNFQPENNAAPYSSNNPGENHSILEPGASDTFANEAQVGGPEANSISRSVTQDNIEDQRLGGIFSDAESADEAADGVFLPDTEPAQIPVDVQHFERPDTSHLQDYIGMSVINREGESIGSIEDVHTHGGNDYIVLDYDDKLFAVPVNALEYIPEEKIFIIDKSRQELENAPGYDRGKDPNFSDMHWNTQLHEFFAKDSSSQNPL